MLCQLKHELVWLFDKIFAPIIISARLGLLFLLSLPLVTTNGLGYVVHVNQATYLIFIKDVQNFDL